MDAKVLRYTKSKGAYHMNTTTLVSYTVKDICRILNLSRTAGYEFINSNPPFRVLHVGKCIRIPKDGFDNWFYGAQDNCTSAELTKKGVC
jgi:hypothetical protein